MSIINKIVEKHVASRLAIMQQQLDTATEAVKKAEAAAKAMQGRAYIFDISRDGRSIFFSFSRDGKVIQIETMRLMSSDVTLWRKMLGIDPS